jgi:hypothetical protein
MVVIGLGKAGCNIAEMFKSYDNYNVLTYDGGKNVPLNESSEGYENGFPNKKELKKIKNETIWFFVCGAGKIAGATLRLLEQIKENKINIVYIVPDTSILPDASKKRNRVAAGVLQEYARSGLFEAIYFVSNESLQEIVGEAPLASYYSKMNELINLLNIPVFEQFFILIAFIYTSLSICISAHWFLYLKLTLTGSLIMLGLSAPSLEFGTRDLANGKFAFLTFPSRTILS